MKRKPLTYLLVLGVFAVWAIIIQKVMVSVQEENVPAQNLNPKDKGKEEEKWYMKDYGKDSIDVSEITNDPFSGKMEKDSITAVLPKVADVSVHPVVKPQVVWPQIVFQGFSSKRDQKTGKYAILSINNQPFMLAEGENALGVKLQKNWGDSLALSFQDQNKKFYLHTQ